MSDEHVQGTAAAGLRSSKLLGFRHLPEFTLGAKDQDLDAPGRKCGDIGPRLADTLSRFAWGSPPGIGG
jgi:hypothetical protein